MKGKDLIEIHVSSNTTHRSENDDTFESVRQLDYIPVTVNSSVEDEIDRDPPGTKSDELHELSEASIANGSERDADNYFPILPGGLESAESLAATNRLTPTGTVQFENGRLSVQSEISITNNKEGPSFSNKREMDAVSLSGVKRPRLSVDEKQPSVHVIYNSLPSKSVQKLGDLLKQWSQWHSQNCSAVDGSNVALESGEETYFPALCVGPDKPFAVTFWMDDKVMTDSSTEFMPLDGASVPLYDRGYTSALASADGSGSSEGRAQKLATSRCFNCGSYSHSLKDCSRPRDNTAVNNARKEHKSRRNQNGNSRNLMRYYQNSHKGKYDGLCPGVLDTETRKVLGLGELDPPPWLNRMREIGYPPGYLDLDEGDQPSGITIFGDEMRKEVTEEGEILDASTSEPSMVEFPGVHAPIPNNAIERPSKKMMVEFPGVNAPIPNNANQRLWATGSPPPDLPREHSHHRYNHSTENLSIRHHYTERRWHRDFDDDLPRAFDRSDEYMSRRQYMETRWQRDLDDSLPPGCEPGMTPSLSSRISRYGEYSSSYTTAPPDRPWTPSSPLRRAFSERGGRNPVRYDYYPHYDL